MRVPLAEKNFCTGMARGLNRKNAVEIRTDAFHPALELGAFRTRGRALLVQGMPSAESGGSARSCPEGGAGGLGGAPCVDWSPGRRKRSPPLSGRARMGGPASARLGCPESRQDRRVGFDQYHLLAPTGSGSALPVLASGARRGFSEGVAWGALECLSCRCMAEARAWSRGNACAADLGDEGPFSHPPGPGALARGFPASRGPSRAWDGGLAPKH